MIENLSPIDSAFVGGSLPGEAVLNTAGVSVFGSSPLLCVLLVISALVFLCFLRKAVDIIPSQLGALLRSKELVNLENSAMLARDRSVMAIVVMVPFIVLAAGYRLYNPRFLSEITGNAYFFVTAGFFAAYALLHEGAYFVCTPRKLDGRVRKAVRKSAWTFFITATEFSFLLSAILSLFKTPYNSVRAVIIAVIAVLYLIFLVRKGQVLSQGCNFFQTFLYLCALEFLPTGILVASALVF